MTKKKNSKQSPYMAFAIIGGISFLTAIIADKFGPNKQQQNNYHANVTHNPQSRQIGQPIGQTSQQPQIQTQPQQPQTVRTIQTSIPVTSNLQITGNPIQAQPIQTEVQQQQPYITQSPIPIQKPINQADIGKNGYRGLISSHSMDKIRDSNKPVIASSRIVNGPPTNQPVENPDEGAYPYPSEILSTEAMVISDQT